MLAEYDVTAEDGLLCGQVAQDPTTVLLKSSAKGSLLLMYQSRTLRGQSLRSEQYSKLAAYKVGLCAL
jgi:hypothetical protein